MTRDAGSIVVGWLTKLVVVIGLIGVLAFDGISLVSTTFQAEDQANAAAREAAVVYKASKDVQQAYDAAVAVVVANGDTIEADSFVADPATGRITLTLHSEAPTMWMYRVSPLKKYTDVKAIGEGLSLS